MSEYSTILFAVRDKVARLTINRTGRPRAASAVAIATPDYPSRPEQWPLALRWMLPVLSSYVCGGWAFALLGPDGAPNRDKKEKIDAEPPTAATLAPSI